MSEYYYVEVNNISKEVEVKKQSNPQPWLPDLSGIGVTCIDVTGWSDADLPEEGDMYDETTGTFYTPTLEQKYFPEGTAYDHKRLSAYPPITEQLDMLYHDNLEGTNTWKETIDVIKVAYPKQVYNLATGEYE